MLVVRRIILTSARFCSGIVKSMFREKIVPDVIDLAPQQLLQISYPSGIVNLGNILTPSQVKDVPHVRWTAESGAFYTLFMTDADSPSRKNSKQREWNHWLVGNIPGNDIGRGVILSAYIGSGPLEKTGLHRYVFLVYRQEEELSFENVLRLSNTSTNSRGGFSTRKFALKYKLGNPIAGNFYKAEFDGSVPCLHKQLGCT